MAHHPRVLLTSLITPKMSSLMWYGIESRYGPFLGDAVSSQIRMLRVRLIRIESAERVCGWRWRLVRGDC